MVIPGTTSDPAYLAALTAYDSYYRLRYEHKYGTRPRQRPEATRGFNRFLEVGKICSDNGWHPDDYVSYIFQSSQTPDSLSPKALAAPDSVSRYKGYLGVGGKAFVLMEWASNEQQLRDIVGPRKRFQDPEKALLNLDMSFAVWFRVLFPWPASEKLYQVFGADAYEELRLNPRLRSWLNTLVCPVQLEEMQRRFGKFPETST